MAELIKVSAWRLGQRLQLDPSQPGSTSGATKPPSPGRRVRMNIHGCRSSPNSRPASSSREASSIQWVSSMTKSVRAVTTASSNDADCGHGAGRSELIVQLGHLRRRLDFDVEHYPDQGQPGDQCRRSLLDPCPQLSAVSSGSIPSMSRA